MRITCIDDDTMKMFAQVVLLIKAMLASEDGMFALYFAKEGGSSILYKLFIKNQKEKDDFNLKLELDLVESLGHLVAGLHN